MTARILDGTKIRDQIFLELKDEVRLLTAAGVRPGLAAVLVGENPALRVFTYQLLAWQGVSRITHYGQKG